MLRQTALFALLAAARGQRLALPLQFSATVETTAHLIDASREYPPRTRRIRLLYDYVAKRARADVLEGLDAGKNFTRLYGEKHEYSVRGGPFPACARTYLG